MKLPVSGDLANLLPAAAVYRATRFAVRALSVDCGTRAGPCVSPSSVLASRGNAERNRTDLDSIFKTLVVLSVNTVLSKECR
jgi:hypothetical protein